MIENVDYELVPVEWAPSEQAWDVRILTGDFVESVIRFGNVSIDGESDRMTFNFEVIDTPIADLDETDLTLQDTCGTILLDVIERSIQDNSVLIKDKEGDIEQL